MKLIIEIDMKGEAFEPEPEPEVNRILDYVGTHTILNPCTNFKLRDINGNICGSVTVEE